jgi:uncharacterized repeat protein (TIGR01451 family)
LCGYFGDFDALGFNSKDNFIYAVEQNSNNIVRLARDNTFERIGKVQIVDTLRVNAGDCNVEGLYMCYDYKLNKILVFDVINGFKLLRQISLFWDPKSPNNGPFTTRIFDFAFDPNDPKVAYSYQGSFDHPDLYPKSTQGAMLKINLSFDDPNLGMVTPLGKIPAQQITHISGLVFNARSFLFGFGSSLEALNPPQNFLFNLDARQGQISPILVQNPKTNTSDGCSCPYSLTFTNAAPIEGMLCKNDTKTFVVAFENNSFIPLENVVLKDTFPEGTVIKSVSNSFTGKIDVGTGVGTNILSISNLMIPSKQRIVIRIEVMSINAKDGPTFNRAYLENLPLPYPKSIGSDDPTSSPSGDRSNFFFTTRGLKKISWQTIPPSDCLEPNDGKIIVTSPEFTIGQTYIVSLRNQVGWKEYEAKVVIDSKNSFFIDSLYPGEYQLYGFRSINDNCSLSLKDTLITLKAPNDQLVLKISGNGLLCEGETLLLKSSLSPDGRVDWLGPDIFGSGFANPVIENVTPQKSGIYEATATFGYCTQKKEIKVVVKKQVNTSISGDSIYCIRDTLRLKIEKAKNDTLNFLWSDINNVQKEDSVLTFPITSQDQSGYYTAISNNGSCYDTVRIDIVVRPTPTIELQPIFNTSFCDPLTLLPTIKGDTKVDFQWFPSDGLSCANCLNPQVIPIVQSNYRLKVSNEYNCADSASTQIILDKKNLLFAPNILNTSQTTDNKKFTIYPNCVVQHLQSLDIFDRLGNRIFTTTALNMGDTLGDWDGTFSGDKVLSGVYVWVVKAELVDGSIVHLTGDVTII